MPATGPKRISEDRIAAALRKHVGIYSHAAREIGCDRTNIAQRVDRSPRLQKVMADIEGQVCDQADAVVLKTLSQSVGAGAAAQPTPEAQRMARWLKDHQLRREGVKVRLANADGSNLPAPELKVTIEYVHGEDETEDEEIPV